MMDSIDTEVPPPNLLDLAEDHYFGANPPPKALEQHIAQAKEFISNHAAVARPVVLITSGGTTVPLGMFPFPSLSVSLSAFSSPLFLFHTTCAVV